jgi:quinoprotein glucose dehydrogenase
MPRLTYAALALPLSLVAAVPLPAQKNLPAQNKSAAEEAAAQVRLADKRLKVEVWAAEPHLANPVAFTFDERGRCFVVETFRHTQGVPDVRGKPYTDDDLACRTVADRLAMYKKFRVPPHPENSERLRLVWDSDGDGTADRDSVFAEGFNRPEDGIAAGVLVRKGDVFFACIPDLYRLRDTKGANTADVKESLASGFGVHVQYIGHDLHGLILGPDGKLYMSVGDRGFNVVNKEGKRLFNPDSGAVLRCDPDGKNLEIVHIGLRNPQELAFDDHGNLFTWDNNSDSGDQARWVYVVEGGDSGWRCGYQHGTAYHTPDVPQGNRGPWNTEKLWLPHFEGQAAYIVPPLLNFGHGPSGITHYPGLGLGDQYKGHFFCADFTGGPGGNSAIWTLAVKPKGAGFAVSSPPKKFITQMLPTDCEFGPDGAFYWSDWTTGWDKPGKGRIFRVTDPEALKNPALAEAKKLLAEGLAKLTADELEKLLEHPHQRVRQEAQFELVALGADARLQKVLRESKNRLARLHAVWGLGQIGRAVKSDKVLFGQGFETDADPEIRRAVVEQLGNLPFGTVGRPGLGIEPPLNTVLKKLLRDDDLRVRAAAAAAYGKAAMPPLTNVRPVQEQSFYAPLFELLKTNNDQDPYLRHAAVMGLFHAARNPVDLWNAWVRSKEKYDIPAVRLGVLLALRKHTSDKVAEFLSDPEPRIVTEAVRAVYDERLLDAFPGLAKLAEKPGLPDAVAYRALAANFWLGTPEAAARVARFAGRVGEADHTRAFALRLLGDWTNPPRRDPITGLTMSLEKRDAGIAVEAVKAVGVGIFAGSDSVRREAAQLVSRLGVREFGTLLAGIVKDAQAPTSLRVEALFGVEALKDPALRELAEFALTAPDAKLRAAGRSLKARLQPAAVLKELPGLLKDEATPLTEKQGAFDILAAAGTSEEADKLLDEWLDAALAGRVPAELLLDVLEAAETRAARTGLKLFAPLKTKVDRYRAAQARLAADPKGDKLAPFAEALAGGDADKGRHVVLNNAAVYCIRCHKLDGQGGEVGPPLTGIAADPEKDRRYLLEAITHPSAKIARGYDTVIFVLNDDRTVSGVIKSEDKKTIRLVTAENQELVVPVEDVAVRRTGPSAMPADLYQKLSRRELRDLVEFLASLKEPPKK